MALLTSHVGGVPDILFLSSTDLNSWTSIALPYKDMSLTTYQSKLVLVGGRHPSTREPTNQLLTSTTGRQWEPSLPPMPTKRYATSSVSTRSPEVLVVTGGRHSIDTQLSVVEVLQGNKWLTVDPIPGLASEKPLTFHDGKLYYMRRGDRFRTVFSCSCTSLISSSKSSGNSSTDRSLWQQFEAPDGWDTIIVSRFSRLVILDHQYRVRGYSSMTRSWLTAASIGFPPDVTATTVLGLTLDVTAATVLNTGELIFVTEYGDVHRGAVSGEREL